MADYKQRINKIRKYYREHSYERHPISNALLKEKDEYVKSLYFRALCALVRYSGEPSEMQVLYLRRLIAGSDAEGELLDYMRMALDMDVGDIDEFISAAGKDDLKYYYCIDGAVVLSLKKPDEDSFELLAELIELLGITRDELKYLAAVAKAVLSFSSEQLDAANSISPKSTSGLSLSHYLADFYTGIIADTPELLHICSYNNGSYTLSYNRPYKAQRVILENLTVTLEQNVAFENCSEVIIRNCTFKGSSSFLEFNNVGQARIEGCNISNFSNRFANFINTENLYIVRNRFVNCGCTSDYDIRGGVFQSRGVRVSSALLEGNELLNCYVARTQYNSNYWATGIFMDFEEGAKTVSVIGNRFTGCECRKNGDFTEAYISLYFSVESHEENNVCNGPVQKIFF